MFFQFREAKSHKFINIQKAIEEKIPVEKIVVRKNNRGNWKRKKTGHTKVYKRAPVISDKLTAALRGENGKYLKKDKVHRHQSVKIEIKRNGVTVFAEKYQLLDTKEEQNKAINIALDRAQTRLTDDPSIIYFGGEPRDALDVARDAYKTSPNTAKTFFIWQLLFKEFSKDDAIVSFLYREEKNNFLEMNIEEMEAHAANLKEALIKSGDYEQ